jgi:hypothetical protein
MRRPTVVLVALVCAFSGCTGDAPPVSPRSTIPPTITLSPGLSLSYLRRNFDQNYNPVSSFQHVVTVIASGQAIGGYADAAIAAVSTSGGAVMRGDTVALAVEGGKLLIDDPRAQSPGRYPVLPRWNTLLDLRLQAFPDTLLSFDSTFTVAMASGHVLRDRVACSVVTRYAGEDRISAFGAPIITCFVFTRAVKCAETVDTAGVLLFQAPVITLLDSIWFADGIGPVRATSQGNVSGIDSLGLPFSLASLQVVHTSSSHDSYEVHYSRVKGRDSLALRESLYFVPVTAYSVTVAYAKNL